MKFAALFLSFTCGLTALSARAGIIEGYVPGADQVRIHFVQAGPADAPRTILFIPGHLISAVIWSQQLNYFGARGYRVVAIDSRSQGESSLAQASAPQDRARDIQAVIANMKLKHLTLVGWSQGVQDVAAYVGQFGTSVLEHIVLVDSSVSMGAKAVKVSPAFVQAELQGIAIYSRHPREYCGGMLHAIISTPISPELFHRLDVECVKTPPDVGISMLIQDLFTTDLQPALERFDKPTLVVASAKSFELDAQRQMATHLPKGQFAVVQHAAHALFVDQPQKFDRLLQNFIAGRSVGTSQ